MQRSLTVLAVGFAATLAGRQSIAAAADLAAEAAGPPEEIIVTGTRAPDRTALTSAAPVDVISAAKLQDTGYPDLARALEFTEPSLNFPRAQSNPAANIRAITLRGLSPDETLVLVDGKRWHTTAMINVNFAVGRGSAPFDLETIPISAIDRVEVLRDGAAAQYGSDAIAGVVNIILKSNSTGGFAETQAGVTQRGDGANEDGNFNWGTPLGDGGRLTLSGEVEYSGHTDRALVDQRYRRRTIRVGDPDLLIAKGALSAAYPIETLDAELYADLLTSRKDSANAATFRVPGTSPLYPNGFLPVINPLIWDVGNSVGLRGTVGNDIKFDFGNTFGYSNADISVDHTANAALGLASPTSFQSGSATYQQDVVNLTLTRSLPEILSGGNIAGGAEYRTESYALGKGEPSSIVGAGAEGYPGYNPRIPVDTSRDAGAGFIDLELKPAPILTLGAAARYDHYSDFGGAATWKASARLEPTDWLAVRASASTGFRAPSLQQEYYSSISSVANGANKTLVNVGTFQVADPIARALGATSLRAEKSRDYSVGIVLTPLPRLAVTADIFRTDIRNRIALSDALSGAAVTSVLSRAGVTNVQQVAFFTNALSTRTEGYDITASYAGDIDEDTRYHLSVGFERSPTDVRTLTPNPVLPKLALIGVHARALLTEAQPRDKLTALFSLDRGPFTGTVNVTRFGEYIDAPILDPQKFSAKTIVDLSLTARLSDDAALTFGILNVGDTFPDPLQELSLAFKTFGGAYVYGDESPEGAGGRAFYLRFRLQL